MNEPVMETEQRALEYGRRFSVQVERMIGMGQGNVLGGHAGGNTLLGYAVRGGEIVGRIKDTMLHCNIYEVLRQVRGIGSEVDELGGATRVAGDRVRWGFHLARWRILSRTVFDMRPWGAHIRPMVEDS